MFKIFGIYCMLHAGIVSAQEAVVLPGTKTPYYPQQRNYTVPPAGYFPVFINYVGRHGSRFLTKEGTDKEVLDLLSIADSSASLTARGKRILEMADRIYGLEKGNYENISLSGKEEQKGIGERMRKNYSSVFDGRDIKALYTKKIRTQQSAQAFLTAFSDYNGKVKYNNDKSMQDDVLRFYDESPAYLEYKKSRWLQSRLDSLETSATTVEAVSNVCKHIFNAGFAEKLVKEGIIVDKDTGKIKITANDFVNSLYELYGAQFSVSGEMKQKGFTGDSINFSVAFVKADLEWFSFKDGAADFLEKGPAADANGIQVSIAVPLLVDFIETTDAAVAANNKTAASLRFTHAEAISPFATLLGISGATASSPTIFTYADYWKVSSVIPMSANIQWIIYSNGKKYLVRVLLNEKEVKLPIRTSVYPYYSWRALRKYYMQKLKSLHTGIDMDRHKYLLLAK